MFAVVKKRILYGAQGFVEYKSFKKLCQAIASCPSAGFQTAEKCLRKTETAWTNIMERSVSLVDGTFPLLVKTLSPVGGSYSETGGSLSLTSGHVLPAIANCSGRAFVAIGGGIQLPTELHLRTSASSSLICHE